MAMYSYLEEGRKNKVYARDAQLKDKGKRYYCPNPECDAHMYLSNLEGLSASYFRASRVSHKHIAGCPYHALTRFDANNHDENAFSFEDALTAMMRAEHTPKKKEIPGRHTEGTSTAKPLRTIKEIYSMCKNHSFTEKYNSVIIGEMLVDNRSINRYSEGVSGVKLIEGKCKKPYFYNSDQQEIYLVVTGMKETYTFTLKFEDEKLFKEIKNRAFANKNHTMLAAGYWTSTEMPKKFSAIVTSKKQFAIVI